MPRCAGTPHVTALHSLNPVQRRCRRELHAEHPALAPCRVVLHACRVLPHRPCDVGCIFAMTSQYDACVAFFSSPDAIMSTSINQHILTYEYISMRRIGVSLMMAFVLNRLDLSEPFSSSSASSSSHHHITGSCSMVGSRRHWSSCSRTTTMATPRWPTSSPRGSSSQVSHTAAAFRRI